MSLKDDLEYNELSLSILIPFEKIFKVKINSNVLAFPQHPDGEITRAICISEGKRVRANIKKIKKKISSQNTGRSS